MKPLRRAFIILLFAPPLALAACGGGSDADKITDIVKEVDKDSAALCDNATDKVLAQVGGTAEKCKETARGYPNDDKIKGDIDVKVDGDSATAKFTTEKGEENNIPFVKEGGDWKIDSLG